MRRIPTSHLIAGLLIAGVMGVAGGCSSRSPQAGGSPKLSASVYSVGYGNTNRPNAASTWSPPAAATKPSPAPAVTPRPPAPAPTLSPAGASGREVAPYKLKPSDPVIIYLRGIFPRDDQIEDVIDEHGYVNLPHINQVLAAGRTTSELEAEIERAYIDSKIYRQITVNVVMPSQGYYVRGEVQRPGRFPLVTGVTVLQAIAAAGGYTEFADPKNIRIIRGGTVRVINARELERHPEKDMDVESGDVVVVPRGIF